jgi:DNA polymerase
MLGCTQCSLAKGRTRVVPGEGPEDAEVMFIGEAPGQNEDRQGRPFVGAAGQFLEELIGLAGLKRSEVYICNVIKCRPPGNRDPLPVEIQACSAWLDEQIRLVRPKTIVTLGRFSMSRWFPGQSISRIHGQPAKHGDVTVYPMYHPAAALHQAALKETIQNDMRALGRMLHGTAPAAAEAAEAPPAPVAVRPAPRTALPGPPPLPAGVPSPPAAEQPATTREQPQQLSFF